MSSSTGSTDNLHSFGYRSDDAVRPSHALQGASLAFSSPSAKVLPSPNTYSGTNGALAAASSAGLKTAPKGSGADAQLQELGNPGLPKAYANPTENEVKRASSTTTPRHSYRVPSISSRDGSASRARLADAASREQSPSHIAAITAASKSTSQRGPGSHSIPRSDPRRPSLLHRHSDYPASYTPRASGVREPTDDTPIAATNNLVKLYESIQVPPAGRPEISQLNDGPSIMSPKPFRPSAARQLTVRNSLTFGKQQDTNKNQDSSGPPAKELSSVGANAAATKLAKPAIPKNQSRATATPPASQSPPVRRTSKRSALLNRHRCQTSSVAKTPSTSSSSSYASAVDKITSTRKDNLELRLHDGSNDIDDRIVTSGVQRTDLNIDLPSESQFKEQSPARPAYNKSSRSFDAPIYDSTPNLTRPPTVLTASLVPQLTADSLANAMVASSLASSRAPSPTKPHLPPPRRQGKPHSLFLRSQSTEEVSRTPSPAKQMRQTLRTTRKSENDEQGYKAKKSHFMKKHPNKHHEGDRKRWRDTVSEAERKRYEGLWAANKNLLYSSVVTTIPPNLILDIVVRDIWQRSRLPEDVLEEIWNLVDTAAQRALGKEEFVVGMWLIDQRLKGRKLPVRVSESVWGSVSMLSGIKHRR